MIKLIKKLFRPKTPPGYEPVTVKEFSFKSGHASLAIQHPLFVHFVEAIVDFFIDAGGENYVSATFFHPKTGPIEVLVQRQEGLTPAQVKDALVKKHQEEIDFLTGLFEKHPDGWIGPCLCSECKQK